MNKDAIGELASLYAEFRCFRAPAYRDVPRANQETIIDLFQEADYLAGLTSSFLGRRRRGTGRMKVDAIMIDPTIDQRLEHSKPRSDRGREVLAQFKHFRVKMLELAQALERATGVPVQFKERERLVS